MGFEKFNNPKECVDVCEELAKTLTSRSGKPWVNMTGTPFESFWGSKDVQMNGDFYDFIGWGEDRQTPWGPLPGCILAIRSDIARVIDGRVDVEKCMVKMRDEVRKKMTEFFPKPLMGPDWKPAPGFERPW